MEYSKCVSNKSLDNANDDCFSVFLAFLEPFGFTENQIKSLCDYYEAEFPFLTGWECLEQFRENPYVAFCNTKGIAFEQIERIQKKEEFEPYTPWRVYAAFVEALNIALGLSKARAEWAEVFRIAKALLCNGFADEVDDTSVFANLSAFLYSSQYKSNSKICIELVEERGIKKEYVSWEETSILEREVAYGIKKIAHQFGRQIKRKEEAEEALSRIRLPFSLDESQTRAVLSALTSPLSVVTGGPGSGKTTITKAICDTFSLLYPERDIVLLSPTATAARKLSSKTGRTASTIHSRLRIGMGEESVFLGSIRESLVIVDEASMVDLSLMKELVSHIEVENSYPFNQIGTCQLVLVGDVDQLCPVGIGEPFKDIVESEICPILRLSNVHRAEETSAIVSNAYKIKKGLLGLKQDEDFVGFQWKLTGNTYADLSFIENEIVSSSLAEIERHGLENVAVLCPYRKGITGANRINQRLQSALNKNDCSVVYSLPCGMFIKPGDPVMHLKNDSDLGICNGDRGVCIDVREELGEAVAYCAYKKADGTSVEVSYHNKDSKTVELSYAMTVHKSQGGEYQSVVCFLTKYHRYALQRALVYTAITRASERVVVHFDGCGLQEAVKNVHSEDRNSLLQNELLRVCKGDSHPELRTGKKKVHNVSDIVLFANLYFEYSA